MPSRQDEFEQALAKTTGDVIVISGPSAAAGKGEVISHLQRRDARYWLSVSKTTRPRRSDDHHNYDHISEADFDKLKAEGEFIEAAGKTEGKRYGTPYTPVVQSLEHDQIVILELDIEGAKRVAKLYPGGLRLFIKPTTGSPADDLAELRRRLTKRGTNDAASIERRLAQAEQELIDARATPGLYSRWVVNATDCAPAAANEIHELIHDRLAQRQGQLVA